MALVSEGDHQAETTIPSGQIFEMIGPAGDDRLLKIRLEGREYFVSKSDLLQPETMLLGKAERELDNSGLKRASSQ